MNFTEALAYIRLRQAVGRHPWLPPVRVAILQAIIDEFGYESYLEIGAVGREPLGRRTFDRIECACKIGVDVQPGATYCMTSNEFFGRNQLAFDLVFVDGDHEAEQSYRDIKESLAILEPGGLVVVHDCLPPTEDDEAPELNGTTWRAFCGFRDKPELDMVTGDFDFGMGLVRRGRPGRVMNPLFTLPAHYTKLTYEQLQQNRDEWMLVKTAEETIEWLTTNRTG